MANIAEPWNEPLRVETFRSGHFIFSAGVDVAALKPLLDRVEDAHRRFASLPILPDLAIQLETEVHVSSAFGTNTIEGGTLTEVETAAVWKTPEEAKEEKERRIANIKRAYDKAKGFVDFKKGLLKRASRSYLFEKIFISLHEEITAGLPMQNNIPGQYRDNPKGLLTKVGDTDHGGVYVPPKCLDDIKKLMAAFVEWANSDPIIGLPSIVRAALVHYYFERIHPFGDGNGRVGRVVEAMILLSEYKYAPFALSRYYLEHIDEYFAAFNAARRAMEKKENYPNQIFVEFVLKGMLDVFNKLHDRANSFIRWMLYRNMLKEKADRKEINHRQYTIVSLLTHAGAEHDLHSVTREPWFIEMYRKRTDKTRQRDFKGLVDQKLIEIINGKILKLLAP